VAFTRRGKIVAAAGGTAVGLVALVSVLALTGTGPKALQKLGNKLGVHHHAPPPTCPLTGLQQKHVADRPALAIKVENLPEARPQAGLNSADIVYEEEVEGGITRFIVVYQCRDSDRVGPVRSARLTDPGVLVQFGKAIFGYAGGVPKVIQAVRAAGLDDVNFDIAVKAYTRDPNRPEPHNLYTTTKALYVAAHGKAGDPQPVFTYEHSVPSDAKRAKLAHLDFSGSSDVLWQWNPKQKDWLRSYGTTPATLEGNVRIAAKNVVVQVVKYVLTDIHDVAGAPSPEAVLTGTGKAYVLRNGKVIAGRWVRSKLSDVTQFETKTGEVIPLDPGNTWVELYPNDRPVEISK
jgi:hypothetical protein